MPIVFSVLESRHWSFSKELGKQVTDTGKNFEHVTNLDNYSNNFVFVFLIKHNFSNDSVFKIFFFHMWGTIISLKIKKIKKKKENDNLKYNNRSANRVFSAGLKTLCIHQVHDDERSIHHFQHGLPGLWIFFKASIDKRFELTMKFLDVRG